MKCKVEMRVEWDENKWHMEMKSRGDIYHSLFLPHFSTGSRSHSFPPNSTTDSTLISPLFMPSHSLTYRAATSNDGKGDVCDQRGVWAVRGDALAGCAGGGR